VASRAWEPYLLHIHPAHSPSRHQPVKPHYAEALGYWWWQYPQPDVQPEQEGWREWPRIGPIDQYDHVLGFLTGIMNTYALLAASRGLPPMGHYITPSPSSP
jgi:hypothetical protein